MMTKVFWCTSLLIICGLIHCSYGFSNNVISKFEDNEIRVCIGTNGRMSVPSNREFHFKNLRDRYTNCTYVDGNLEITWIQNNTYDLSFLEHIREVTGYVLISHVDVEHVRLPRLQIIRGRTLFKLNVWNNEFGLFVSFSQMQTLELPALRDILNGSVGMFNNYNLCHVRTIQWEEILSAPNATNMYTYNFTSPERDCPPCHSSCEKGCWGEGPENCQKFSKVNCSPQCSQGRCFGSRPRECCHLFCAGGCTGPTQKDCLACKNFYDDGECKQECPSMQIYNPTNYLWEANPNGKYAYGATCVRHCPEHLLKDNGACVRTCPSNKMAKNGECVQCNGPCPKTCISEGIVHSGNIEKYKDCTIIEGSLEILDQTFAGYQQVYSNFSFGPRFIKINPDKLEVFSTVKEITGYLNIQGYHEQFTNLSYFRNLEVIGGRQLRENLFASLYIVKTSLTSLGLKSLKRVNSGAIVIVENKHLCFANEINWDKIKKSKDHEVVVTKNKIATECEAENEICSEECSSAGCWGKGPDQCLECKNFIYKGTCLPSCKSIKSIYQIDKKTCGDCHPECKGSCTGPNADDCEECVHVKDGKYCVANCSSSKYPKDGICIDCHEACNKCNGPRNTIAEDGCTECDHAIIHPNTTIQKCLKKNATCPDGYYHEWVPPYETTSTLKIMAGKSICRPCHPRCKKCTQYGFHESVCTECAGYRRGEQCDEECSENYYANEKTRTCDLCHEECQKCRGPGPDNCLDCKNFKIFHEGVSSEHYHNTTLFNCTSICPPKYKYKIFPEANDIKTRPYCSSELGFRVTAGVPTLLIIIFITLGLVLAFLIVLTYLCRQKTKAKKDAVKMSKVLTGCEDSEPLRPTNVGPNLTKLRIIKEAEIRRGGILGMGAFGRVYKGVWVPEGENVKIPVAIKVLTDINGSESSKEFLDEAYIMCSVEHPNLLKLHAICMTSQMMLITQLMPLGSLLDYVRNNKDKIGSKALLNWSTQIARGMSYLEERRLVHRDLAARNVLVQTPSCVKITDFGLAKLLDYDSDAYCAAGGKMPIKWLALECIRHRIFTSKSDVWSFGITVWELLTYGARPYENIPAKDVPGLIEVGHKLPQPDICSLDIYCILLSCWVLDADARPTFKQLAETFADKARDPGRYLVIPGDKFMRLPSYTTQDEKDLIRTLAPLDGSNNTILDAEEYLQPKSRQQIECSSTEQLENLPKRYCSDPLKNGDDETDTSREVGVGNLRLDLPLDEDDYLMPTGPSQGTPGYMDLIGVTQPAIDNPEYLLNSNSTANIVTISENIKENNFQNLNNNSILNNLNNVQQMKPDSSNLPTQTLGIPLTNAADPTTSDHDYYNDLQREMQPLHTTRSETTV
ncbi:hypothetical protein PVAND_005570 [Polypedilum vanderplanki]|uniref:Receptor protein-tyrosine kinase n=1 Tax=Polypedilum vanderplanki TaxID=319348 RepID=A0A9J6C1F3_POLVA|nr:hypothetical protein PVAND_005570 [Polypedilum vanderplanki]